MKNSICRSLGLLTLLIVLLLFAIWRFTPPIFSVNSAQASKTVTSTVSSTQTSAKQKLTSSSLKINRSSSEKGEKKKTEAQNVTSEQSSDLQNLNQEVINNEIYLKTPQMLGEVIKKATLETLKDVEKHYTFKGFTLMKDAKDGQLKHVAIFE